MRIYWLTNETGIISGFSIDLWNVIFSFSLSNWKFGFHNLLTHKIPYGFSCGPLRIFWFF